jgi:hypothetical protein
MQIPVLLRIWHWFVPRGQPRWRVLQQGFVSAISHAMLLQTYQPFVVQVLPALAQMPERLQGR